MYKCRNCKTIKDIGDDVYIVDKPNGFSVPTCSKECAEVIKQEIIKDLEDKLNKIKNTEIKKEIW